MKTSVQGYPRIGKHRELKFATEAWLRGELSEGELHATGKRIRAESWKKMAEAGIDRIPSNDFSLYDPLLDTACLVGAIPERYRIMGLSALETLFAMARGRQKGENDDVKALPMRKWFNTNYHYIVSELSDGTRFSLSHPAKPVEEFLEALSLGIRTMPVIPGAMTFLSLARLTGNRSRSDYAEDLARVYRELLSELAEAGAREVVFDEPYLASDLDESDKALFVRLYELITPAPLDVALQIPYGDIRDVWQEVMGLPLARIALDFIEGPENLNLLRKHSFPRNTILTAGIISGKNVWKTDEGQALALLGEISHLSGCTSRNGRLEAGTASSLVHVPLTVAGENALDPAFVSRLSFAEEKLAELVRISGHADNPEHVSVIHHHVPETAYRASPDSATGFPKEECTRTPGRRIRRTIQAKRLALPPLPTTTIGSFPQTSEVRSLRAAWRKGAIDTTTYTSRIRELTADCIREQEELGLDVLVHGEFERTDMVEFFGQQLNGFAFTANGWVQSYGTRCVKPPLIVSDVSRKEPMTVELAVYAQSLTNRPVKGMLTGPVTILNWSFPREDIPLAAQAFQIARALREEVLDLERNGIGIIQIDEAALQEKLPRREADRKTDYLNWAIPAFRMTHAGVKPETQIHTHMCYSDFTGIVRDIDEMDADVITFEAARSEHALLSFLAAEHFQTAVGPGIYDIHSPRVPDVGELYAAIHRCARLLGLHGPDFDGLWVNPDCGLKTRGREETMRSLANLVEATRLARKEGVHDIG